MDLCLCATKIYEGTAQFYTDLDGPAWRLTDCELLHTAYKVSATGLFAIFATGYVTWKAITE